MPVAGRRHARLNVVEDLRNDEARYASTDHQTRRRTPQIVPPKLDVQRLADPFDRLLGVRDVWSILTAAREHPRRVTRARPPRLQLEVELQQSQVCRHMRQWLDLKESCAGQGGATGTLRQAGTSRNWSEGCSISRQDTSARVSDAPRNPANVITFDDRGCPRNHANKREWIK